MVHLYTAPVSCTLPGAVASFGCDGGAAAYRSGEKLVNEWNSMTHDYTRKLSFRAASAPS